MLSRHCPKVVLVVSLWRRPCRSGAFIVNIYLWITFLNPSNFHHCVSIHTFVMWKYESRHSICVWHASLQACPTSRASKSSSFCVSYAQFCMQNQTTKPIHAAYKIPFTFLLPQHDDCSSFSRKSIPNKCPVYITWGDKTITS